MPTKIDVFLQLAAEKNTSFLVGKQKFGHSYFVKALFINKVLVQFQFHFLQ